MILNYKTDDRVSAATESRTWRCFNLGANFLSVGLRLKLQNRERGKPDPGKRGNGDSFPSGLVVGKFPPGRHSCVSSMTAGSCVCFRQSAQATVRDSLHLSGTKKGAIISCFPTDEILEGRDCLRDSERTH